MAAWRNPPFHLQSGAVQTQRVPCIGEELPCMQVLEWMCTKLGASMAAHACRYRPHVVCAAALPPLQTCIAGLYRCLCHHCGHYIALWRYELVYVGCAV
jgi:hypothetical protein